MTKHALLCICASMLMFACTSGRKTPSDTPTSGAISIAVEESYAPLMDTEIYTFQSFYPKAKISPVYKPEDEIIKDLLRDSIRLAVIARDLTEEEKAYLKSKTHPAYITHIAVDGVALILHPENTDTLMTLSRVKRILAGEDTAWSQLNSSNKNGTINIVFDNNGSANYRYIHRELLHGKPVNKNVFALKSNQQVLDYVSNNRNAIGVISAAWVSDMRDPKAQEFMSRVKVVAISEFDDPASVKEYKKPYQAWIYNKTYPLRRNVYIVKIGTRSGIGTGFASFLAGEKGQLIIHKQGMVAAQSPVRLMKFE